MDATLPKAERLCGKTAVVSLFESGKNASEGCIRCKYIHRPAEQAGPSRIVVSVPKRHFKRAVRRNLLKRRIRESYRRQKDLLVPGTDVMFIYKPGEMLSYPEIYSAMEAALKDISAE